MAVVMDGFPNLAMVRNRGTAPPEYFCGRGGYKLHFFGFETHNLESPNSPGPLSGANCDCWQGFLGMVLGHGNIHIILIYKG